MAGYSGTPLPRKLGVKPGARMGLLRSPGDFSITLGALPDGVVISDAIRGKGPFDVVVCFARTLGELSRDLGVLVRKLDPAGGLWIAWPKKASGLATDVSEVEVRRLGLGTGLVDNKVCAIDDVWSGLRFVVRVVDRPKAKTSRSR
jgi:hypothetical protein